MFGIPLTRRIKIGGALIYLAGFGYLGEAILPFLHIGHKVLIFTAILTVSELLFLAGVAVLGKTTYAQIKQRLIELAKRRR